MTIDFILKIYYEQIIIPLEKEYYRLQAKIYSKRIFDLLLRPAYQSELILYKQLLCEHYKNVGELITQEKLFMDDLM